MAPSREIEKLQRRWQENPLGLTFAPLAEAYRKEGMFADALDLLSIGLSQHPNYVPAHIVRGRCFLDTREDASAGEAFHRVVELDPENVIALKGLAEIAERAGRYQEAQSRLERLLEFDRSNEEAAELLQRVRAAAAIPQPGQVALAPEAPLPEPIAPEPPAPEPEPAHLTTTWVEAEPAAALPRAAEPPAPIEVSDPSPLLEEAAPFLEPAAAAGTPAGDSEPGVPFDEVSLSNRFPEGSIQAAIVDLGDAHLEVVRFQPVELAGTEGSEYQVPADSEALRPAAARGAAEMELDEPSQPSAEPSPAEATIPAEPAPQPEPEPEPVAVEEPVVAAAEPGEEREDEAVTGSAVVSDDAEAVAGVEAEPDLVVTETMAEVFLRQGHRELALAVYTQLVTREPDNPRILDAIARLEGDRKPASPALPAYAAVLTGGQSIRAFFEQLLSATRPAGDAPQAPGLSLGAVFGEGARPEAAAAAAAEPGPSYDEFYGDEAPSGDVPAPSAAGTEGSESNPDDLESFTSWLKGLKR
jgi:tetratricopeptide (TPR) repeat protein